MPAEPKRIGHRIFKINAPRALGDIVKVAVLIRHLVADRRRYHAVVQRKRRNNGLSAAGRAEHMAGDGFRGADGQLVGMAAESGLDRARLDLLVERRGSAVRIDIGDLFGRDARIVSAFFIAMAAPMPSGSGPVM